MDFTDLLKFSLFFFIYSSLISDNFYQLWHENADTAESEVFLVRPEPVISSDMIVSDMIVSDMMLSVMITSDQNLNFLSVSLDLSFNK